MRHPDRNPTRAKEAHQLMIRLGLHRDTLVQFTRDSGRSRRIRRLLGHHLLTCVCSLCHELWQTMPRCRFCLGTDKKHGYKGRGLGTEASYFQRNHLAWYPTCLICFNTKVGCTNRGQRSYIYIYAHAFTTCAFGPQRYRIRSVLPGRRRRVS